MAQVRDLMTDVAPAMRTVMARDSVMAVDSVTVPVMEAAMSLAAATSTRTVAVKGGDANMRPAIELFVIQFTYYLLLVLNYRAVGAVNYMATFLSDIAIATLVFMSIQRVAAARADAGDTVWFSYVVGGASGAVAALWISTHWLGV